MTHLSRREFLKCAGVSVLGGIVGTLPSAFSLQPTDMLYGRALQTVPIYPLPSIDPSPIAHLWPDTIIRLFDDHSDWYRLENGYAKRELLQPVLLSDEARSFPSIPCWAEVSGAVAIVRQWCSADAPLVARIGHGGVAQVIDMLPGSGTSWLALGNEDGIIGWSQVRPWRAVENVQSDWVQADIRIDTHTQQLEVSSDAQALLRAPVTLNSSLTTGTYSIQQRQPSVKFQLEGTSDGYGTPWYVSFGDYSLAGVYWHNHFGTPVQSGGPSVQVVPAVARWLYQHLPSAAKVRVV